MTSINNNATAVQQINKFIAQGGVKAGELVMLVGKSRPVRCHGVFLYDHLQQRVTEGDKILTVCMESTYDHIGN